MNADVLCNILNHLSPFDLLTVRLTSTYFNQLIVLNCRLFKKLISHFFHPIQIDTQDRWNLVNEQSMDMNLYQREAESWRRLFEYMREVEQIKIFTDGNDFDVLEYPEATYMSVGHKSYKRFDSAIAGVSLFKGHWYYEYEVLAATIAQFGLTSVKAKLNTIYGSKGIGDDEFSFAFDGQRVIAWGPRPSDPGFRSKWGKKWKVGSVVGCCVDIEDDFLRVSFYLDNEFLGVAFESELGHFDSDLPCAPFWPGVTYQHTKYIKGNLRLLEKDLLCPIPEGYTAAGKNFTEKEIKIYVQKAKQ